MYHIIWSPWMGQMAPGLKSCSDSLSCGLDVSDSHTPQPIILIIVGFFLWFHNFTSLLKFPWYFQVTADWSIKRGLLFLFILIFHYSSILYNHHSTALRFSSVSLLLLFFLFIMSSLLFYTLSAFSVYNFKFKSCPVYIKPFLRNKLTLISLWFFMHILFTEITGN